MLTDSSKKVQRFLYFLKDEYFAYPCYSLAYIIKALENDFDLAKDIVEGIDKEKHLTAMNKLYEKIEVFIKEEILGKIKDSEKNYKKAKTALATIKFYINNSFTKKVKKFQELENDNYDGFMRYLLWLTNTYPRFLYFKLDLEVLQKNKKLRKKLCKAIEKGYDLKDIMEEFHSELIKICKMKSEKKLGWGSKTRSHVKMLMRRIEHYRKVRGIKAKS